MEPGWSIFRCGPESHSLLRFNNAPQRVDAKADITPADGGFSINLTPAVRDQVRSAQRHFTLNPDLSLTIRDTWRTDDAGEVTWQWLTRAKATKTDDGFRLEQSGESLRLVATASSQLTFEVEDVSAPRAKFDSPNPGLHRLVIRRRAQAGADGWISLATSASGQEQGKPEASQGATDKSANPLAIFLPAAAGSLFQSVADLRAASESLDRFGKSLEFTAAEIGGTLERIAQQLAQMSSGFDPFGFQHAFKTIGQQLEMIREQQAVIERLQQDEIARLQQEIQQLKASNKAERNQPERRKSRRRHLRE